MSSFKCKLNLTEKTGIYLAEAIVNQFGGKSAISIADNSLFSSISTSTEAGMYAVDDDYGTSYILRGAKDELNNNVIFAGYQWKVVRVNGDGSVRLIYNGTEDQFNTNGTVNSTGTDTQIGTSAYSTNYRSSAYVGYMYGTAGSTTYAATHANTNDSTLKSYIDSWYEINLKGKTYESYISDTLFCNDRSLATVGYPSSTYVNTGISNEATYYAAWERYSRNSNGDTSVIPILTCSQQNDAFTVNDTTTGNGALKYSIGLLTYDEAWITGLLVSSTSNSTNYLYTEEAYWTGSPSGSYGYAGVWSISSLGRLAAGTVDFGYGVRPVINLVSTTTVTGSGSATDPYIVL